MKAAVFDRYGPADVLEIADVPRPIPKDDEVLVRVFAAGVSAEDPKMRAFDHPPMLRLPIALLFGYPRPRTRVLGMELSGEVTAVGRRVKRFAVGDQVFGYTGIGLGAHAEYRCLRERGVLARVPDGVDLESAAVASNGALTALVYLRDLGSLARGERVVVVGASGAVGTAAVQIAKLLGAHVTGVCSTANLELVRSLGADEVIDYTTDDFTEGGAIYDVVFDTVGATTLRRVRRCTHRRSRYLVTVFGLRELAQMLWTRVVPGPRVIAASSNFHWSAEDLAWLGERMASGALRAVVDRSYPLAEVRAAHRYVEGGHKRGNVVLRISDRRSAPRAYGS